jgi:hypothetical protein
VAPSKKNVQINTSVTDLDLGQLSSTSLYTEEKRRVTFKISGFKVGSGACFGQKRNWNLNPGIIGHTQSSEKMSTKKRESSNDGEKIIFKDKKAEDAWSRQKKHCKKRLAIFPSPAGISLTKPFWPAII